MKLQHRRLVVTLLVLTASLLIVPAVCRAQLLPAGDFQGKPLDDWTLDWIQWGVATGLGEQTLPDTVNGVRFLPPNFGGGDFVANLTIPQGTPLMVSPFFVIGERYDTAPDDNPADPFINTIFEGTTIRTTYDGNVVLEGLASAPDRRSDVVVFAAPIPYADPQPRGPNLNAVAAIFGVGVGTIFDGLPLGPHTIKNEFDSAVFGRASYTYNVTVVPEPSSLCWLGAGLLSLVVVHRRARWGPSSEREWEKGS
jgi:hypothetical protein